MQVSIGSCRCHTVRSLASYIIFTGHRCYIDRNKFQIAIGIISCYGRASYLLYKLNLVYDNQI